MHDLDNMGVGDFWANAGETLRRGTGDSEDIAIAKMQVLKAAGFSPKDLYISIGRHNVRGAHVVLVARAAGGFYVLDDTLQNVATPAQHGRFTPIMTLGQGRAGFTESASEAAESQAQIPVPRRPQPNSRDARHRRKMSGDPYNLDRFITAQAGGVYEQALAELNAGHKTSHWMWFIFPQHRDLGRSSTAKFYGLSGIEEAVAYADHPLLGERLRQCCRAILPHLLNEPAENVLGRIDALKLRSSMEIFAEAVPDEKLFREVLVAIR